MTVDEDLEANFLDVKQCSSTFMPCPCTLLHHQKLQVEKEDEEKQKKDSLRLPEELLFAWCVSTGIDGEDLEDAKEALNRAYLLHAWYTRSSLYKDTLVLRKRIEEVKMNERIRFSTTLETCHVIEH